MAGVDGKRVDARRGAATGNIKNVRDDELEEICHRRWEAFQRHEHPEEVRQSLIGLALSGGGIRSASVALGVLQSLHARRILPFIDYMSTVSGGGYAGAYLSSVALKAGRKRQTAKAESATADESQATNKSRGAEQAERDSIDAIIDSELFPIARTSTGQPQKKMLHFIHGGNYLRKTWVFFNRYLIGLLLIWSVVLSGLVAVTSLAAWAFRSLDHTSSRAWIAALGFEGEIKLAFFPSFVLLIIWLILWSFSYFKFGARSTGIYARSVFFMLVFVTLVAIAALLGNGEYDFSGGTRANTTGRTIFTIVFGAIAASLLPYLRPTRLVRSGTAPKNTVERYTFWVATRALVYGVPFIFVAFFARENISGWNERRDDRLTRAELDYDNYLSSPLWRQVADAEAVFVAQSSAEESGDSGKSFGAIWRPEQDRGDLEELVRLFRSLEDEEFAGLLALSDFDKTERMIQRREDLKNVSGEFSSLKPPPKNEPQPDADAFANETDDLRAHLVESAPQEDSHISFPARWWYLIKYLGESVGGDTDKLQENPVYRLANEYVREREIKWKIARRLNKRLEDPQFFDTLLPEPAFEEAIATADSEEAKALQSVFFTVKPYHPGVEFEDWRARLRELRRQASVKQAVFKRPEEFEPPRKSRAERLQAAGQLSGEAAIVAQEISQEQLARRVISTNRELLKAFYGTLIDPKSTVWSSVVLAADQRRRMQWFLASFGLFVIAGLFVDLNATSWHGFYSAQIGKAWIAKVPGMGQRIPLTRMETSDVGRPYHLVGASVHVIGKKREKAMQRREGFLFSRLYCGSEHLGYAPTAEYMKGMYTLDDAIAVSGAAVSPVQTGNPLVMALLTLFNVRLGQWVANPACPAHDIKWLQFLRENWPITPFRVLFSMYSHAERRPTCFVADGGHHENLAVEPLLARRCRLILAMDAGSDRDYEFSDLAKLIRIARISHGIRFERIDKPNVPIDLALLTPSILADEKCDEQDSRETGTSKVIARGIRMSETAAKGEPLKWSDRHYLVLKIKYPATDQHEPKDGYLIYMKSTLTGDEPVELRQFKSLEPEFPHNPTADQFYDPVRFDAYVQLGYHIANQVGPVGERFNHLELSPSQFIQRMSGVDELAFPEQSREESQRPSPPPIDDPLTAEERKTIEDICTRGSPDDEDVRRQFENLGVRLLQATPQLLKAHLNTEDPWLQKVILQYFLEYAEAAFPHLCKALRNSRDAEVRVAALRILKEYQNSDYGVDFDELQKVVSSAKRSKNQEVKAAAGAVLESFSSRQQDRRPHRTK